MYNCYACAYCYVSINKNKHYYLQESDKAHNIIQRRLQKVCAQQNKRGLIEYHLNPTTEKKIDILNMAAARNK